MENLELSRLGEDMAAKLLISKGYRILARNWRFSKFEIDILARNDKYLVVVEVKTRETDVFGHPSSFLGRKQQLNLSEALEAYLESSPDLLLDVRYDVISVLINQYKKSTEHFEDAFWPDNLGSFSFGE